MGQSEKPLLTVSRQLEKARRLASSDVGCPCRSLSELLAGCKTRLGQSNQPAPLEVHSLRAQKLDREIAALQHGAERLEAATSGGVDVHSFFARHVDSVLAGAVEEARRAALTACHERIDEAMLAAWERAKPQVMLGGAAVPDPATERHIIDTVTSRRLDERQKLVQVRHVSCAQAGKYKSQLEEIWQIVGRILVNTKHGMAQGAIRYMEEQFDDRLRAECGQDVWSQITATAQQGNGNLSYMAFLAFRAGNEKILTLLSTIQPISDLAGRLLAKREPSRPQALRGELLPAAYETFGAYGGAYGSSRDPFRELLSAVVAGQPCSIQELAGQGGMNVTTEDWLWLQLHHVLSDEEQFGKRLKDVQAKILALGDHYFEEGGRSLAQVKSLLLTLQIGTALEKLGEVDPQLRSSAVHLAVLLSRENLGAMLEELDGFSRERWSGLVRRHAAQCVPAVQLKYIQLLDVEERGRAVQELLFDRATGSIAELLGYVRQDGSVEGGCEGLERQELTQLCSEQAPKALRHGMYAEALHLLHTAGQYQEVVQVILRCLRLPIWQPGASLAHEREHLDREVDRFVSIYDRKLADYRIPEQAWTKVRRAYFVRRFLSLVSARHNEQALELFEQERLLECDPKDLPRVLDSYLQLIRLLFEAARPSALNELRQRVHELSAFVSAHRHLLSHAAQTTLSALSLK